MKLTIWYSKSPNDRESYSIRATTRRAAKALIADSANPDEWAAPRKIIIEYSSAHDLLEKCLEPDGYHSDSRFLSL